MKSFYFFFILFISSTSSQDSQQIVCQFQYYDDIYNCYVRFANVTTNSAPLIITGTHIEGKSNEDVLLFRSEILPQNPETINFLHPQLFEEFPNLESLHIFNINLMELKLEKCEKISEIYMFENQLEEIPNGVFQNCSNLKTIEIWFTNAKTYQNSFDGLVNLETLIFLATPFIEIFNYSFSELINLREFSCSDCSIIEADALKNLPKLEKIALTNLKYDFSHFQELLNGLTNLTILNLSSNNLTDINFEFFSQFGKLNDLTLNNIGIDSLPNDAFINLTSLISLSMSQNKFSTLNPESFRGMTNLKQLRLEECEINDFSSLPFIYLSNLTHLYASKNPIKTLPSTFFENKKNLEKIYFTYCEIEVIEKFVFDSLPNLSMIYLDNNNLTSFDDEIFVNLPNLIYLYVSNNQIKRLNANSFGTLRNLREINVRYNQIDEIDPKLFEKFPSLYSFYANDNVCLSRTVTDVQSIDFKKENVFSTCFYNYEFGRTEPTSTESTTTEITTKANDEENGNSNWIIYLIVSIVSVVVLVGLFFSIKILFKKGVLCGS